MKKGGLLGIKRNNNMLLSYYFGLLIKLECTYFMSLKINPNNTNALKRLIKL